MVFPWITRGMEYTMASSMEYSMEVPRHFHGIENAMAFPWGFHGVSVVFPWCFHGI